MKNNRKGFTLAELLIVVAIIGVLVAIAIPILNGRLERARFATNQANARGACAAAIAAYLTDDDLRDTVEKEGYCDGRYDIGEGRFSLENTTDVGFSVKTPTYGQPGDWSVDDDNLEELRKTVYSGYIIVVIGEGGVIKEYRFNNL